MTDMTIMECVKSPTAACLSSPHIWLPIALLAFLVWLGFIARRRDVIAFRRLRRRALFAALALIAIPLAVLAYLVAAVPAVFESTDTSAMSQTSWIIAVTVLGAGMAALAGALALSLGGRLAKQSGGKARSLAPVIAIDGPAASGKGTLAKRIAEHYHLPCLDTGLLYRAVARDVVEAGGRLEDSAAAVAAARALDATTLDDPSLRGPAAGDSASLVARIPDVRAALLDYQKRFAAQPGGAVLDGRDIGTIVCPNANVKLFVTATVEERARRRHVEHTARGEALTYETVLDDLKRRDARDSGRDIAPMEPADDALRIDSTKLNADQVFAHAIKLIDRKLAS